MSLNFIKTPKSLDLGVFYGCDGLNRPVKVEEAGLKITQSAYNKNSQPISITQPNGSTTQFEYDALGRKVSETNALLYKTQYRYDAVGNLTQSIDPLNRTQPLQMVVQNGPLKTIKTYQYDTSGLPIKEIHSNGTVTTRSYDAAGRIASIEHTLKGNRLSLMAYQYDQNGNRTQDTISTPSEIKTTDYVFDTDDRLLKTTEVKTNLALQILHNKVTEYVYDTAGNRTAETITEPLLNSVIVKNYTVNTRDQVTLMSVNTTINSISDIKTISYTYDAAGNRISKTDHKGTESYVWNAAGNLINVSNTQGLAVKYRYNAEGLRDLKTMRIGNDVLKYKTTWALGRANVVQNVVLNALNINQKKLHDRLNYAIDSDVTSSVLSKTSMLDSYRQTVNEVLHSDALGSITDITDTLSQTQLTHTEYDAFGNAKTAATSAQTPYNTFGFTGQEMDAETGLIYFKARYYDPELGRFLSKDAFEGHGNLAASWHSYQYAYNNPLKWVDPSGNQNWPASWVDMSNGFEGTASAIHAGELNSSQEETAKLFDESAKQKGLGNENPLSRFYDASKVITNAVIDMIPVIGDVKIFAEAETKTDYAFAALGVIPLVGDGSGLLYKLYKAPTTTFKLVKESSQLNTAGRFVYNPQYVPSVANKGQTAAIKGAEKAIGDIVEPVYGATTKVPLGFKDITQFQDAMTDLQKALKNSNINYERVGVSGSSVTGHSFPRNDKPSYPFDKNPNGALSDIDAFFTHQNVGKRIKMSEFLNNYPELKNWSEIWSNILNRPITPMEFKTIRERPTILLKEPK